MTKLAEGDLDVPIPAVKRHDEIGEMARALEVFKANAEQVKISLEKERELNGLQRQFVSMVSHEFRTPLAIIDAVAQRVERRLEKLSPDDVRQGQKKVRVAVSRLTDLMESVLSASRLEEGRIAFEPTVCPLFDLVSEVQSNYSELHKGHEIILDIDRLPRTITADSKLLRQVVSNLLSNAIKYSPDGKHVWVKGYLDDNDEIVLSFCDEGVGIPKEELDKLFKRFFRASTSTGIAGSGIGLNMVQHFMSLHGGRIDVESTEGVGSTFTVRMPYSASLEAAA
ncbi:MAG: HAMP domain-containing sensor histidine kinase [Pseudomonadota bacterium]